MAAPEFTAGITQDFLRVWGVRHRVSSAYFPQSNGRAEVAVKTAKRLLMSNTGPTGSLDHDRFLRAMLQLRNTPDPDCNVSPAQILFGRPLRDTLSFVNRLEKYTNPHVRPLWRQAWAAKEGSLHQDYAHHRSIEGALTASMPTSLRRTCIPPEPAREQPQQVGQVRGHYRVDWPRPVPCQSRRIRARDLAQSTVPASIHTSHSGHYVSTRNIDTTR